MKFLAFTMLAAGLCFSQSGTVEGIVVNSATGAGIAGADVVLRASARFQTSTDSAGRFRIAGMPTGTYSVGAGKDGFTSAMPPFPGQGQMVQVGADVAKVEVKLTPLGKISGRVLDPDGKPVANAEVRLVPNILGEVMTDEDGRFLLDEVRSGTYTLVAAPPVGTRPKESDGAKVAMVSTYYPSVADGALAQPVVFRGEGDLLDYDIRMQTASVHRVSGVVLDAEGKPSRGAQVWLYAERTGSSEPMPMSMRAGQLTRFGLGMRPQPAGTSEVSVTSGADGRFEFPAVPAGEWRIHGTADTDGESLALLSGWVRAPVDRRDVDDLEIRMALPFALRGVVQWSGTPASDPLMLTLVRPDNEVGGNGHVLDGSVIFSNLEAGTFRLLTSPGVVAQVFLGPNEVAGTFPLSRGGPPLRVVLKIKTGSVRGTVDKGAGATVVLIPQRANEAAIGQTVVCGAGGSFEMNQVSPGDYYVAAFDRVEGLVPSASTVALVPVRGKSVTVVEGSSADVMLSVTSVPR